MNTALTPVAAVKEQPQLTATCGMMQGQHCSPSAAVLRAQARLVLQLHSRAACSAHEQGPHSAECVTPLHSMQPAHLTAFHAGPVLLPAGTTGGCHCDRHL